MQCETTVDLVTNDTPWVEKYRPSSLQEVRGQEDAIELFQQMMHHNKPIHFLFYGPPGTGKTSTILSFCKELYKGRPREQYMLEINASYDRGIDMVRQKIKPFCKRSTTPFKYTSSSSCEVNYKFVILDEADTLTEDAQNALRRCIEIYSYNTRFCFLCNYVTNIITPIVSRCYKCHFKPVEYSEALYLMADVCKRENIRFSQEALTIAYKELKGDLRACLTVLQSTYNMHGEITDAYVNKQLSIIDDTIWTKLLECKHSRDLLKYINDIQMEAFSVQKLLVSLIRWAFDALSTEQVYKLASLVSRIERQLLYQTESSLLLHELFFTVWSVHHT